MTIFYHYFFYYVNPFLQKFYYLFSINRLWLCHTTLACEPCSLFIRLYKKFWLIPAPFWTLFQFHGSILDFFPVPRLHASRFSLHFLYKRIKSEQDSSFNASMIQRFVMGFSMILSQVIEYQLDKILYDLTWNRIKFYASRSSESVLQRL